MNRRQALLAALALLLALPLAAAALPAPVEVVAAPGAWVATYATPAVAVPVGGAMEFVNADLMRHNVVSTAYGPGDEAWCKNYPADRCPLLWSALVGLGARTPVLGTENLVAGESYEVYCTLHPRMTAVVVALPGGAGA